jgi:hypothetical protein
MKFAILSDKGLDQYDLTPATTIGQLKDTIRRKYSISTVHPLHLTYRARYLPDTDSLGNAGVPEGGTLIMVLKPRPL